LAIKISLHSVSYAGFFYAGSALPLKDVLLRAVKYGYKGVELTAKRPHGLPSDLDQKARREIRELYASNCLEISIVAGYTNFAEPLAERRDKELVYMKEIINLARDLNVNKVRIFAAGMGEVDPRYPYTQYWEWCKDCLRDSAEMAEEAGVILGLQNHLPLMHSYRDVLDMIEEVGSPALKAMIDPPLLSAAGDPIEKAVKDSAKVLLHHVHVSDHVVTPGPTVRAVGGYVRGEASQIVPMGEGNQGEDLRRWFKAVREIGYNGWVSYEVCSPVYEKHRLAPLAKVDILVERAAHFLKEMISEPSM